MHKKKRGGSDSPQTDSFDAWVYALSNACGTFHSAKPSLFERSSFIGKVVPARTSTYPSSSFITTNCSHIYRKNKDIRLDGHDFYYLVMQQRGHAKMCQGGDEAALTPGDMVLLDASLPSDFYFQGVSQQLSIILPRNLAEDVYRHKMIRPGQRISANLQVSRMATLLVASAISLEAPECEDDLAFLEALACLLKPVVCTSSFGEISTQSYPLLRKAMIFIEARLDQGSLSAARVAQEIGVSERTLYRLFAKAGVTVGQYILDKRLERCANILAEGGDNRLISQIARNSGFIEFSNFSHVFKKKYGLSPRAYRKQRSLAGKEP